MVWQWKTGKRLRYLTIPEWEKLGVKIGFSSREHGVSDSPFESLNLGLHVGDDRDKVLENRLKWFSEWNTSPKEVVVGQQVHGTQVYWVNPEDAGRGSTCLDSAIPLVDALVTDTNVALMAFFADCVPVYFFNPVIKTIGIAHAGWKGTIGKIVQAVLDRMAQAGGKPEDCLAAIGPGIGPCCYEIDDSVAGKVRAVFGESTLIKPTKPGKYMLDLWGLNKVQLIKAGILEENISICSLCTSCNSDAFFSYRRDEGQTGRMSSWIRLNLWEAHDVKDPNS